VPRIRGAKSPATGAPARFYYVTMMNENYAQPDLPEGVAADVIRGCYHFKSYSRTADGGQSTKTHAASCGSVTLLGSGAILTEVIKAALIAACAYSTGASG
jgi:pyruvate dehydrogenase E1 component